MMVQGRVTRRYARARGHHTPGQMNKLEARYAAELEARKLAGEIVLYRFEALKLKLAKNTFLTPDFFVIAADSTVEFHECKGFWEDDARVKIKVAAEMFPFRFIAVKARAKKDGGGWAYEEF